MRVLWIILAVLSFIGSQIYLFLCLRKLDQYLESRAENEPTSACEDGCGYPEEDVVK